MRVSLGFVDAVRLLGERTTGEREGTGPTPAADPTVLAAAALALQPIGVAQRAKHRPIEVDFDRGLGGEGARQRWQKPARIDLPNVRELEHLVSRLALTAAGETSPGDPVIIRADMLGREFGGEDVCETPSSQPPAVDARTLAERLDDFQRSVIRRTLKENGGNWAATARALGLHRSNLHHRASRLGLLE